jgi:hypothetical protein
MAKLIVHGNVEGFYATNFEIEGSFIVWDENSAEEIDDKIVLLKN